MNKQTKKSGTYRLTRKEFAQMYNVSLRTFDKAGAIRKVASVAIIQAIEDGRLTLHKAEKIIKEAERATGITITKHMPLEDRQRAHEVQDMILRGEPIPELTDKERVLTGEFDATRWEQNAKKIQSIIKSIERLPKLYNNCFELLKGLDHAVLWCNLVTKLRESVVQTGEALRSDTTLDVGVLREIISDLTSNKFQIPETIDADLYTGDAKEVLVGLREQFIADCQTCMNSIDEISRKLSHKISN